MGRLENFIIDFNRSCNEYLDVMGIVEEKDRAHFMNGFQRWSFDTSNERKLKRAKHVTTGHYDKQKAIQQLLFENISLNGTGKGILDSGLQRCQLLKNSTTMLDYTWLYENIC